MPSSDPYNKSLRRNIVHGYHEFLSKTNFTSHDGPASRQGNKKLVYRLIRLFSSTEIFSKRRKIYAWWRKTRVNSQWVNLAVCRRWLANASGVCIYHLRACALNYNIYKKLCEAQNFHTTTGRVWRWITFSRKTMAAISFKVMFVDACFLCSQLHLTYGVPPKDRRHNKSLELSLTCSSPLKT